MDTSLFDKAVIFAVNAHRNTERKGHNTPYVLHVLEAASICQTMTEDIDILIAAVLHDVVEDTETTIQDIKNEFGSRIASLVNIETEKAVDGKTLQETWRERREHTIKKLTATTKEAKMVALGDKLSNIRAISRDYAKRGEEFWGMFHGNGKQDIKWYYTGLVGALSDMKEYSAFQEFESLVNKVFG